MIWNSVCLCDMQRKKARKGMFTVYGGGSPSPSISLSLSKLSWLVAIDGSELDLTNCGKFPNDNDVGGPGLISKSDSGLDAYDKRDEDIGNKKSSDNDSAGWFLDRYEVLVCVWGGLKAGTQ